MLLTMFQQIVCDKDAELIHVTMDRTFIIFEYKSVDDKYLINVYVDKVVSFPKNKKLTDMICNGLLHIISLQIIEN